MFTTIFITAIVLAQPCLDGVCRPGSPLATEAPHPAVVRIVNDNGRERTIGSGTLVAKNNENGLVVSCGHLFREYVGRVSVTFGGGETFQARVLEIDTAADLSALSISLPGAPRMEIANAPPRAGEKLTSCGFGPNGQFMVNRGRAIGYVSLDGRTRDVLELTGAARQGDSGGPIVSARGELAGVLFGTDGQRVEGVHCGRVREFLKRHISAKPQAVPSAEAAGSCACGFARIEPRLAQLEQSSKQLQAQLAATLQKSGAPCPCDPTLPDRIARLEASRLGPPTAGDSPRAPEGAARSGGGLSWALEAFLRGKLTAVLVGFGLPGGVAAVATWFFMRRTKKRLKAIVIHDQSPPPPQVIERERQFVEVQVPTDRLGALEWAMDEYVKRNPGARPTVETIEAYAKQFQSGARRTA
jgi:hypothetical protein